MLINLAEGPLIGSYFETTIYSPCSQMETPQIETITPNRDDFFSKKWLPQIETPQIGTIFFQKSDDFFKKLTIFSKKSDDFFIKVTIFSKNWRFFLKIDDFFSKKLRFFQKGDDFFKKMTIFSKKLEIVSIWGNYPKWRRLPQIETIFLVGYRLDLGARTVYLFCIFLGPDSGLLKTMKIISER